MDRPATPWWRRIAAIGLLAAIVASTLWFQRFAASAEPGAITAATAGYVAGLVILSGCLVALLIGLYDVARLPFLTQAHESTMKRERK